MLPLRKTEADATRLPGNLSIRQWRVCCPKMLTNENMTYTLVINVRTGILMLADDSGDLVNYPIDHLKPFIDYGAIIMRGRIRCGYSRNELANIMHIKKQAVVNWETGKRYPTEANVSMLEALLNIDLDGANHE